MINDLSVKESRFVVIRHKFYHSIVSFSVELLVEASRKALKPIWFAKPKVKKKRLRKEAFLGRYQYLELSDEPCFRWMCPYYEVHTMKHKEISIVRGKQDEP